jgi:hypothetical protein
MIFNELYMYVIEHAEARFTDGEKDEWIRNAHVSLIRTENY